MAEHDRCWARHQSITDPAHHAVALALAAAAAKAPAAAAGSDEVEQRDLAVYDAAFGIGDQEVA